MNSLAIPAHLRATIDIDDVRQGAGLRLHWNQKALQGRSAREQRAYRKEGVASELTDVIRRFRPKRRHAAREWSLHAEVDGIDLSCFRSAFPVREGMECLGNAEGRRGVHDGA